MKKESANVIKLRNKSAVVKYTDSAGWIRAVVVPYNVIEGAAVGDTVTLEILPSYPYYGIDWDIIYPDGIHINSMDLNNAMYSNGIVDYADFIMNISAVTTIINNLMRLLVTHIVNTLRSTFGG